MEPMVSVIIPVYNSGKTIPETIQCFLNQTFQDFEIICIDDGSTDNSVKIIQKIARNEPRIHIYFQANKGAGAARNHGIQRSRGKYLYFFDSDDLCDKTLLEKTVSKLEETGADIVGFNFEKVFPDGTLVFQRGCYVSSLQAGKDVFNYQDLPSSILSVYRPVPWNKVYRAGFVKEKGLKFEEISSTNDITFAAVSAAYAEKATYLQDALVQYRIRETGSITKTKEKNTDNIITALKSVEQQTGKLSYYEEIKPSVQKFIIDNYIFSLNNYTNKYRSENARDFYTYVHTLFSEGDFSEGEAVLGMDSARWFNIVRKYDFDHFYEMYSKKIVVSMTTYPARIGGVADVLDTIYNQSRKADAVVLWLAETQFPGREADLPENLKTLIANGQLTVEFCRDIKAHKKYLYAFEKYPDSLIITIDDDLLYHPDMIETLVESWIEYPEAVSTMRTHLMLLDKEDGFLPYNDWFKETDVCLREPCMQLLATGGAGAIYYPPLFQKTFFDEEKICELCYDADDIWLKLIEVTSGIPVVLARNNRPLRYLPGSQTEALWHTNVGENLNDIQLNAIQKYLIDTYGSNLLFDTIYNYSGRSFLKIADLMPAVKLEKKILVQRKNDAQKKLKKSLQEKQKKLEQTEKEMQILLDSTSWKVGSAITYLPGTIKRKLNKS